MKKLLSLTLAFGILLSLVVPAKAAIPSGWGGEASGSGYEYKLEHSKSVSHTGRASLYVYFPMDYKPNHYISLRGGGASLSDSKRYIMEYYYKGLMSWKWVWDWTTIEYMPNNSAEDWTKHTIVFTPDKSGGYLGNLIDGRCDGYIDDITIFELDDDGNKVGENLCTYGDFEMGDFEPCKPVSNVETESGDKMVTLSWTNPTDKDFDYVDIYMVEDDESETFLTSAIPELDETGVKEEISSCTIENLDNDKLYIFKLYAIDKGDNKSEAVQSFGKPVINVFYTGEITAEKAGSVITELSSGTITVKSALTNNTSDEAIEAVLVAAVYKDNTLIGINSYKAEIPVGESAELSADIEVPADSEGCELYGYLWDGNYNILSESLILK